MGALLYVHCTLHVCKFGCLHPAKEEIAVKQLDLTSGPSTNNRGPGAEPLEIFLTFLSLKQVFWQWDTMLHI